MTSAQELAETLAEKGREVFETDGFVAPALFLLDSTGHGLGLVGVTSEGHPAEVLPALAMLLSSALHELRYVGTNVEAWGKTFEVGQEPTEWRRGLLQEAHENLDLEVRTLVLSQVLDIEDLDQSYTVTSTNVAEDTVPVWDVKPNEGRPIGLLPERLIYASKWVPEEPPPDMPLELWGSVAVKLGLAGSFIVI